MRLQVTVLDRFVIELRLVEAQASCDTDSAGRVSNTIVVPIDISSEKDLREALSATYEAIISACMRAYNLSTNAGDLSDPNVSVIRAILNEHRLKAESGDPLSRRIWAKAVLATDQSEVTDKEFEMAVYTLRNLAAGGDLDAAKTLKGVVPALRRLRSRGA